MHGEDLVVEILAEELVVANGQLRAHQQRQNAGQHKEQEGDADIEGADDGVVDRGDESRNPLGVAQMRSSSSSSSFGRGP